ncbi:MAG: cytochrome c family protein [Devosia sp.]|uniref:c-type cytochrome n=1 Tax=Devosia sp. TaxID=1871048 RepID=UPI002637307A|nr:cytochrome c family protein [Devosia sp.]MDB5539801.1 cytochrome c family protein [Devosia sp.]
MDSFELNKIIGAILGTLLFVMGVGFLAEAIYHPIEGHGPGYNLPEPEVAAAGGSAAPAAAEVPLGVLLASASASAGQTAVRKCQSCHNFAEGAGNKQGPDLYGVVGRLMGSVPGFAYSDAMLAHKAAGDTWTYENLNAFITAPKTFMPGTKMGFAGDKDPADRANILAYLQTLSPTPVPFPPAEAAPAAAAAAPAAGAAAPADAAAVPGTAAPAADGAAAPVETPTTTATETPVQGTPAPATTEPVTPAH